MLSAVTAPVQPATAPSWRLLNSPNKDPQRGELGPNPIPDTAVVPQKFFAFCLSSSTDSKIHFLVWMLAFIPDVASDYIMDNPEPSFFKCIVP